MIDMTKLLDFASDTLVVAVWLMMLGCLFAVSLVVWFVVILVVSLPVVKMIQWVLSSRGY